MKIKVPKAKSRNPYVMSARSRSSGGPMKHRLEPRKGAKNDQPDLLAQVEEEVNTCEHGDHPAPPGKRFCSVACQQCEIAECDDDQECAGLCKFVDEQHWDLESNVIYDDEEDDDEEYYEDD